MYEGAEGGSALRKARDFVVCWWVLLRAKLTGKRQEQLQVSNCLQLRKGTRFRLSGGQMQLLEDDES